MKNIIHTCKIGYIFKSIFVENPSFAIFLGGSTIYDSSI